LFLNGSRKWLVAQQECKGNTLLHFHWKSEHFYIADSSIEDNNEKGIIVALPWQKWLRKIKVVRTLTCWNLSGEYLLRGTNWVFRQNRLRFFLKGLIILPKLQQPQTYVNKWRSLQNGSMRWRSSLTNCVTSRKVVGSIPDGFIGIFHWHNPSGRTMALTLTQPLTEMSTRNIFWGWRRPVRRADNLTTFMCRLSWNLGASTSWNSQGLSRPVMGLIYLYLVLPGKMDSTSTS